MADASPVKIAKDPRKAPQLTREDLAKLTPKERDQRVFSVREARMQQSEVEICRLLTQGRREGFVLDASGERRAVPVEDVVVQLIGADDTFVNPPQIRERFLHEGGIGSCAVVLHAREFLANALHNFRLPPDAEIDLPGENREQRRAARQGLSPYPFRDVATVLRKRPEGDRPGDECYYVVIHSAAGAVVVKMRADWDDMQALVDDEDRKARGEPAPAPEPPVLPTKLAPIAGEPVPAPEAAVFPTDPFEPPPGDDEPPSAA